MRSRNRCADAAAVGELAPSILMFLAADIARLERFLAATGLRIADVRTLSQDSGFAENLLEYIASDEPLLRAYAAAAGLDLARIEALRQSVTANPCDG